MNLNDLYFQIQSKKSFLCVGLDTDIDKIPKHLLKEQDPVFEFNKAIVDATADIVVAYKPNFAFYEAMGITGMQSLLKTTKYIKEKYPEIFLIADAKRGDIGNTAKMYAKSVFEIYNFDSITLSPYMGHDSITPFLEYPDKWVIVLGLTSNPGAADFQLNVLENGEQVYINTIKKIAELGDVNNIMFVVGATRPQLFQEIRKIIPHHFLLVPGVGAQGGNVSEVYDFGHSSKVGLIVNSSRGIIYADSSEHFAQEARNVALILQKQMAIQI